VELTFNGHACFTLTDGRGRVVVTDPYRSGALGGAIAHAPVVVDAAVVTVSHYHVDHGHLSSALGTPQVVDRAQEAAGIAFRSRTTYHDRVGGSRMGLTRMFAFEIDGLRIAHLGDIGCDLSAEDVGWLGRVDLCLWPVGGVYTLGPEDAGRVLQALKPRVGVPMHFRNPRCGLPIAPVEALPRLDGYPTARPGTSSWSSAEGLPEASRILVLEPAL
jgi:L-ascorbate metabolism protein UlaG (beta-lactamase superfamily)